MEVRARFLLSTVLSARTKVDYIHHPETVQVRTLVPPRTMAEGNRTMILRDIRIQIEGHTGVIVAGGVIGLGTVRGEGNLTDRGTLDGVVGDGEVVTEAH